MPSRSENDGFQLQSRKPTFIDNSGGETKLVGGLRGTAGGKGGIFDDRVRVG
jgi:hypothetical protein